MRLDMPAAPLMGGSVDRFQTSKLTSRPLVLVAGNKRMRTALMIIGSVAMLAFLVFGAVQNAIP
jgi:hypothetical protein